MLTAAEFRQLLKEADPLDIVNSVLLTRPAAHLPLEKVEYIGSCLAASYGIDSHDVQVIVTGSAHLGFSLVEKKKDNRFLPRYRSFSAESDFDVAIISIPIFDLIWHELSVYFSRAALFPPDTGRLGDYLVSGWLRPDHFPMQRRLPFCNNWFSVFDRLSRNSMFQRRKVKWGHLLLSESSPPIHEQSCAGLHAA